MGRMTWDLATLQYYCWAGRAGRKAYSDYAVDPDGPTQTTPQVFGILPTTSARPLPIPLDSIRSQGT